MRRPLLSLLIPIALALAGLLPAGSGAQTLVNIATDATDPSNLDDSEPSIAVNPQNPLDIAVVTFSEGWSASRPAPVWRSSDGGATWRKVFQLVQPSPSSFGPADQKIAFSQSGKLYVAELASGLGAPSSTIFRQTGGTDDPLTPGAFFGDDQPHLEIDRSPTATQDRLYSPWLDFSSLNTRSTVASSADFGAAVTNLGVGDNSSFPNRTTRIAVGPEGRAYIIYKTREGTVAGGFENAHFRVNRSDDGGATWNAIGAAGVSVHGAGQVQTWFTTSWGNPAKGKVARARSSDAWIAADAGDGDVYAAYVDQDDSTFGQIYVARSTDGGVSWTSHRATDGTHHSAFPEIAVTDNGTVGVLYVDFDDSGPATIFRHRFARSADNGATWVHLNLQSMNPSLLPNASSGFLWGDYEGLTAEGSTFYGVFTGASTGRSTAQFDPIFFSVPSGNAFFTLAPCRLVDTRNASGPLGGPALASGVPRVFPVAGACNVPLTAKVLSINVTAVGAAGVGFVTLYPGDGTVPATSTVNLSAARPAIANNAQIALARDGTGTLAAMASAPGPVHLVIDVNGYFQ